MKFTTLVIIILILIGASFIFYLLNNKNNLQLPINSPNNILQNQKNPKDVEMVSVVAQNLDTPWGIVFLPDNSILVTERKGTVRLISPDGVLQENPIATLSQVKEISEGGLLGIDIHPNFASNKFVYLYYTYAGSGNQTRNRVSRFIYEENGLTKEKVIVDNIPGAPNHNGGRIKFGPDRNLYIGTGDAQEPSLAQNKNSLAGKILRVTDKGEIVSGNPFGNHVYSFGHRNVQGLVWDSEGNLWATEHGRSGIASGFDELNLIKPGQNYGWPDFEGDETGRGITSPIMHSGSGKTWAPAGAAYINDTIYFVGLRGQTLYKASIKQVNNVQISEHLIKEYGRLRDVVLGPDNMLYVTTSNLDGRGSPNEGDDKILRINPQKL